HPALLRRADRLTSPDVDQGPDQHERTIEKRSPMNPLPAQIAGKPARRVVAVATLGALTTLALLASCGGSGDSKTVTVQGDIPIAYTKRDVNLALNPTNGAPALPGGDLMIREKASPSAPEYNITAQFTQGRGDVSSPSVSYDGKKIVFS